MAMKSISIAFLIFIGRLLHNDATHFQGGTITYKVLNTSGSVVSIVLTQTYIYDYASIRCNSSMIANQWPRLYFNPFVYPENSRTVQCIQFCNQSGGYIAPSVVSTCTDFSVGMSITVGQRSDIINITNGSYFLVAFQSASWRQLSRPPGTTGSNTSWSVSSWINVRLRENGQYNQPPVATIISPIYIPVGVQQTIVIPTIDGDNDQVRCRFAQGFNECGSVCPPASLPNGTKLFSNCTLLITGINVGDWYAIAIAIEDFGTSSSTTPFSTVPVQFLINVQSVSSCPQRPSLTSVLPNRDDCVGLQVNQTYVVQLIAEVSCPSVTIIDIATLSFPVVIKSSVVRNTTTKWSTTLSWTPTAAAIGSQILCAVAVDSNRVQSNQYCLSFTVAAGSVPTCPGQDIATTSQVATAAVMVTTDSPIGSSISSSDSLFETTATSVRSSVTTAMAQITSTQNSWEISTSFDLSTAYSAVTLNYSLTSTITSALISSTTLSTSSDSSFPWLWIAIILGTSALILALLGLCCCCWYFCPALCGVGRKRNRPDYDQNCRSQDAFPESSPIDSYMLSNTLEQTQNRDGSYSLASSSSNLVTPRAADGIEIEFRSNTRPWRIIHYRRLLPASPRVTPIATSSSLMYRQPDRFQYFSTSSSTM